jgi:pimeloyl-ACP methyl ester carboxylesterase
MNGSFRQIDAGVLDVGYVDAGPIGGDAVVLLHGWPYDIYSYDEVVPLLTGAGHRVVVPYLRGFGTTRFLSNETPRDGGPAALAFDVIALVDALAIERAILAGFDLGARTAEIAAARSPERCLGLVSLGGPELGWWYRDYFATEDGRRDYGENRREFNRRVWRRASPGWDFDDATYDRTAASFDNPDHVDVVVHTYGQLDRPVPTMGIGHRDLDGVGHNVPQEAPEVFARAVLEIGA